MFQLLDRRIALTLALFAITFITLATFIPNSYYNGPIGPHHWAYIVGGGILFFAIALLLKPSALQSEKQTQREWKTQGIFVAGLLSYAMLLPLLGFIIATIALMVLCGYLFGGRIRFILISATIMSLACYGLFQFALGISLPSGEWFR